MTFASADPLAAATRLWAHLARPVETARVTECLLGLSRAAARLTSGVVLVTSPEADTLLAAVPGMLRNLAVATNARADRLVGEVRGPIQWSETLAARSASAGDPQLYVCASVRRAYDTPENRVLVAALRAVLTAGQLVERQGLRRRDSELARHVRRNTVAALRFLDHRALVNIAPSHDRRDVAKVRTGRRRAAYAPALAALRRFQAPVQPAQIAALAGPRARAQHAALVAVLDALADAGLAAPLRPVHGALVGGSLAYVHDEAAARTGRPAGISVGDLLLDVPVAANGDPLAGDEALARLAARAGGRQCAVVRDADDVHWALTRAGVVTAPGS